MNNHERLDLTEWVIHFVHDRCTKDIPELYEDSDSGLGHFPMPDYFDEEGNPHTFMRNLIKTAMNCIVIPQLLAYYVRL